MRPRRFLASESWRFIRVLSFSIFQPRICVEASEAPRARSAELHAYCSKCWVVRLGEFARWRRRRSPAEAERVGYVAGDGRLAHRAKGWHFRDTRRGISPRAGR